MSDKKQTAVGEINHYATELKKLALDLCKSGREKGHDTSAIDQINMELQILLKEIQQAKEMERQQIIDAHLSGFMNKGQYTSAEYYNQTFKP